MQPTRIFLDLDDVLNNFTPFALAWVGCPISPFRYDSYPSECGYDIVAAANKIHPTRCFTSDSFWGEITRNVWATSPRSWEFANLLSVSYDAVGPQNVRILTKATNDPECLAGKKEWLTKNCPPWIRNRYLIVGDDCKEVCSQPGALLVDDNEDNVAAFRASGGQAIIMPRPWNRFYYVRNPVTYLRSIFRRLFHEGVFV